MSQYESRVSSLETEVNALKAELMENESKFHLLYCQLNVADQNIKRVRSRVGRGEREWEDGGAEKGKRR